VTSTLLPLLALSNWGLVIMIGLMFVFLAFVSYVVLQGTRTQMAWRERAAQGDVDVIRTLVSDEIERWRTTRMPRGTDASVWHGVQSAQLLDVTPDSVRVTASAEGEYAPVSGAHAPGTGERREVKTAFEQGLGVTARLADLLLYDVPNVRLPSAQIDIYSTFRDEHGATQRCIISTVCDRAAATDIDWDETPAEDIVRAFGGRYLLDDRGNALPINVEDPPRTGVPAAFYRDD
jgi:hypothetical protein